MIERRVYEASILLFSLLGSALVVFAQAQGTGRAPGAMHSELIASNSEPSTVPDSNPKLEVRYPRYAIQLQDVLLVSFPLSPELNQSTTVQPDGYINLQGTGSVHVQGLTIPELAEAIKHAYEGILHEPIVNVDLVDFQKPFFTVAGQVTKPGQYELRANVTPLEAIAVAGGLVSSAKTQIFVFHRTGHDWYEVEKVNLRDVLNGKHVNEVSLVKPGDVIVVPEKFITNFRKYVPYSLNLSTYLQPNPF